MNREINVTLTDASGKQFSFKTLRQIEDFCIREHQFWVKANSDMADNKTLNQTNTKLNYLEAMVNTFKKWKELEPQWEQSTFNSSFHQLEQQQLRYLSGDWIWHGHPFVSIWIELHDKSQNTAESFLQTVLRKQVTNISASVDHMIGIILGYEYLMQDESDLTKRRLAEKSSLSGLRDELIGKK